jgi:hypothetical protein
LALPSQGLGYHREVFFTLSQEFSMNYANVAAPHSTNQQLLRRVEKSILIAAAVLAVAALIAHHTGISAAVGLIAVLAITVIERLKALPTEADTPLHARGHYRYADGGSFRAGEIEKKTPAKQSTVVIDGGTKH